MRMLAKCIPVIMVVLIFTGCAGRQKELLAQEYMNMSNDRILQYYYELSEEIDRCMHEPARSPSIGIGTGFGLGWLGLGLGVSKNIHTCDTDELRQRRIAVRLELQHRKIDPGRDTF